MNEHSVLVVDDSRTNVAILEDMLLALGYRVTSASNGEEALQQIADTPPDLILLDIKMPGMDGYDVLQVLKTQPETRLLPVIVITVLTEVEDKVKAIELGADEFLSRPFSTIELEARTKSLLRQKSLLDQLDDAENVLFALANATEAKDKYTREHIQRVTRYAEAVAVKLSLSECDQAALRKGCILHDIGKIGIPTRILNKPTPLTPEEFAIIKQHPVIGMGICLPLRSVQDALPVIRWHHEKLDGSGYPDGIAGDAIPLIARIMTVVDVYDALANKRPYRPPLPQEQCGAQLRDEVDKGWWDSQVVEALIEVLESEDFTFDGREAHATPFPPHAKSWV